MSDSVRVGVIGAGTMGRGIAQCAALAGYQTTLCDVSTGILTTALEKIEASIERGIARSTIERTQGEASIRRLNVTTSYDFAREASLVIEAVPESMSLKQEVFARLDEIAAPGTILASNTSSLSVNALGSATCRQERFLGLHFFNPAHVMPLVEVISGDFTSRDTVRTVDAFVERLGKRAVHCKDTPAFIVNRVARPFYGEAYQLLGEGAADVATLDNLVKSLGFRMGPFELIDLIGCDVNLAVTESVYRAYYHDPKYRPHPIQRRMVDSNRLGRKTGRGFYDYGEPDNG